MRRFYLAGVSVLLWTYFVVSSVVFTPVGLSVWLITVLFDRKLRILHLFSCFWGAQYIWIIPFWSLKVYDRNKFDDGRRYIMVSNHQSLADIVVVYSLFKHFRWTSKAELFKTPFVGWVLSLNRSIKIYRGANDAYRMFEDQAIKAIRSGNTVMIFPEGTRSGDGKIGKFKEGAFKIAHMTKTDILPLVLDGTSRAIPKSGWVLRGRQRMILKVLDPVPYKDFQNFSVSETSGLIKEKIEKALKEIQLNSK